MGIGDLCYGAASQILALGSNGLPVCCISVQPAWLWVSLDMQLIKNNLHNHVNVRYIILFYVIVVGWISLQTHYVPFSQEKCVDLRKNDKTYIISLFLLPFIATEFIIINIICQSTKVCYTEILLQFSFVWKISEQSPKLAFTLSRFRRYTIVSFITAFPLQCFPLLEHTLHMCWALPCALDSVAGILSAKCPLTH
jgi:hypothetical protein